VKIWSEIVWLWIWSRNVPYVIMKLLVL